MMKISPTKALMAIVFTLCCNPTLLPQSAALKPLDAQTQETIIAAVSEILNANYVFPETAVKMTDFIKAQLMEGAYSGIQSLEEFADALTKDLRSICKDQHLRIAHDPDLPPPDTTTEEDRLRARQRQIEADRKANFYFREVKHLDDNIGYLRFDKFADPKLAGPTASAAMQYLADCDALIIDLRFNGGGAPDMVTFLLSYFFDEPVNFNNFYSGPKDEIKQEWTYAYVDGPRLADTDLYVLLSSAYSFSAAEGFAYALQTQNRATIVGETTGGGAHDEDYYFLRDHSIVLKVPARRAYDPKTGLNWEGTGVEPDVKTTALEAFEKARDLALRKFIAKEEKAHGSPQAPGSLTFQDLGIAFAEVKGGSFEMGDIFGDGYKNERPAHPVALDDFSMGTTEITFAQFDRFCEATGRAKPDDSGWGRGDRPVIDVSWTDARDFCVWLSMKTGQDVRLPTEAEWEYAARGGGREVRFGNGRSTADPGEINFNGGEEGKKPYSATGANRQKTMPVASFPPNALGIHDMAGNVQEWCADWYDKDYYLYSPSRNPRGPESAYYRILKGGAWDCPPAYLRCSFRGLSTPDGRYSSAGFRIVKDQGPHP